MLGVHLHRYCSSGMRQVAGVAVVLVLLTSLLLIVRLSQEVRQGRNLILQQEQHIRAINQKIYRLQFRRYEPGLPIVYVITPTYARPVQIAELTRLLSVFQQVPNLHWIVVEDASTKTALVENVLKEFPHNYTLLNVPTPPDMKIQPKETWWKKPRGVYQRNLALSWLRDNAGTQAGVFYFADDDNTYTVDLFEEIRYTKTVSVLPVGLVGGVLVEKPKLSGGKVVGWEVGWDPDRPFATDMAGFAVNLKYFLEHPGVQFLTKVRIGHQESEFLKSLVKLEDLQPVSIGRVLVWHTRTEKPNLNKEEDFFKTFKRHSDVFFQP